MRCTVYDCMAWHARASLRASKKRRRNAHDNALYIIYCSMDVPGWNTYTVRHNEPIRYRLLFFDMLLRDFFSAPLPSPCPASSAFRFVPAAAAEALVLTETSVDLPAPPDAIFATCASAALQSAAESLIAYLVESLR